MQNFIDTQFWWEQNEICIEFALRWKNLSCNGLLPCPEVVYHCVACELQKHSFTSCTWANMALGYSLWVCLLLRSFAYIMACNENEPCDGCESPLMQNTRAPWGDWSNTITPVFSLYRFKFLPRNSFVLFPHIEVRKHMSRLFSRLVPVLLYFLVIKLDA